MFRSSRWRSDRNRIRVAFRLQFHATQLVPQLNAEGLILSLVPGDVGKPTARLEKATVEEESCRWKSPVCETVKFVQDAKTGKIHQKIYHFVVSTTGSKRTVIGDASIDFANYTDSIKISKISLPLQNSNSKAMLHVSIQRLLENEDQLIRGKDASSDRAEKQHQGQENHKSVKQEDGIFGKNTRIAELRYMASIDTDSSMSSCDGVSELDSTPREIRNSNIFAKSLSQSTTLLHSSTSMSEEPHVLSESEWSESFDELEKLKAELIALTRKVDVSDMELQSLRKQIAKENKKNQELLREVNSLKHERDFMKVECERLKAYEKQKNEVKVRNKAEYEGKDPWILIEEIEQELDYVRSMNSTLRIQLQKTQESNTELILAVQDLEAMLEQRNGEIADVNKEQVAEGDEDQKELEKLVKGQTNTKETDMERKIMELYNEIEMYKRDKEEQEIQLEQLALDYEVLKQENHELSYKLEQSELQDQLKSQYEFPSSAVNVSELENQVDSLETELWNQSKEFSKYMGRIKDLEKEIKSLQEELEKQAERFESDIEAMTRSKVEQEKRAIMAEEALRNIRWRHANVTGKFQKDFKNLSVRVSSTFEANEEIARKAMVEANELRIQKLELEEMLKKANDELRTTKGEYEAKIHELLKMVNIITADTERVFENQSQMRSKVLEDSDDDVFIGKERGQKSSEALSDHQSQEIRTTPDRDAM